MTGSCLACIEVVTIGLLWNTDSIYCVWVYREVSRDYLARLVVT